VVTPLDNFLASYELDKKELDEQVYTVEMGCSYAWKAK